RAERSSNRRRKAGKVALERFERGRTRGDTVGLLLRVLECLARVELLRAHLLERFRSLCAPLRELFALRSNVACLFCEQIALLGKARELFHQLRLLDFELLDARDSFGRTGIGIAR